MDTDNTLAIVAYILQFTLLTTWMYILDKRMKSAKCRCSSTSHPLLDPVNP